MKHNFAFVFIACLGLSACTLFQENSHYYDQYNQEVKRFYDYSTKKFVSLKSKKISLEEFAEFEGVNVEELRGTHFEKMDTIDRLYRMYPVYQYQNSIKDIDAPFAEIQDAQDDPSYVNQLHIINDGTAALEKRLQLIEDAKRTLEVEYFIFSPEELSTQVLLKALMEKADEGVQVKILLDKTGASKFNEYYVEAVKKGLNKPSNFQVKYYNPTDAEFLRIVKFFSDLNFRNHRKLLVRDNVEAITGGRNIEDKYFDMDLEYNFHDRDIWVKGPIVPIMRESFMAFWEHSIVEFAGEPKPKKKLGVPSRVKTSEYRQQMAAFVENLKSSSELEDLRIKIAEAGIENLKQTKVYDCEKTTFVSDKPGGNFESRNMFATYKEEYLVTERAIGEFVNQARESVIIASPYFTLNTRTAKLLDDLLLNSRKLSIYTNSLASTDAFYMAGRFYDRVYLWQDWGMIPYVHNAKFVDNGQELVFEGVKESKWGMHSKSHVYDDDKIFVGTFNIDNRSSFYNTEMGIFCEGNRDLADDVLESIEKRAIDNGLLITGPKKAVDANGNDVDPLGPATQKQRALFKGTKDILEILQFIL